MKGREKRAPTIKCFRGTFAQLYGTWKVSQQLKAIASRFWLIINRSPLPIDQKCIHNKNFRPQNTFPQLKHDWQKCRAAGDWTGAEREFFTVLRCENMMDGGINLNFSKTHYSKFLALLVFRRVHPQASPWRKMERMNNEFLNTKTIYFYKFNCLNQASGELSAA